MEIQSFMKSNSLPPRRFAQLASYAIVGGLAALVEWSCFFLLYQRAGTHYLLSSALAFLIATAANYAFGKRLVFRRSRSGLTRRGEVLAVYAVSAIGLAMNLLLMHLFVQRFEMSGLLSKLLATGVVFIWNFLVRKRWIYRAWASEDSA